MLGEAAVASQGAVGSDAVHSLWLSPEDTSEEATQRQPPTGPPSLPLRPGAQSAALGVRNRLEERRQRFEEDAANYAANPPPPLPLFMAGPSGSRRTQAGGGVSIVLPPVAALEARVAGAAAGSDRRAGLQRLLERSRRASTRGSEGAPAAVNAAAETAPRPQPPTLASPSTAAAPAAAGIVLGPVARPGAPPSPPPSLRTMAEGIEGKVVLEIVQRAALKTALKQVERAREAKAMTTPLERQRRVCDAWLRVMATVRELPPSHLRFGDGAGVPGDYKHMQGGRPADIAQLWATRMPRGERRREELRLAEAHYAMSSRAYWSSFSDRRVDAVREELQEAARASPNGFMAAAFRIMRRTRPSACGNKARAPAPDLMCAIFEGGDDKDPSKLRTGADGFREELLKQGNEMYAARPSCGAAVDALLARLGPVLRRHEREEAGEAATPETEASDAETLVQELMPDARWRQLLGAARARLAVGDDGFPAYLLRQATAEVQGLFLDGLRDIVRTRDVPASWSVWPVILAPKPGKDRRLLRKRRDITLLPHAWALFMKLIQPGYSKPVEAARPWCQSGFESFRTPPCQTLGLRAAMEQAMAMRSTIAIAFLDYKGFFNSIIRMVQRRCEAHFGVAPRLTDIVFAVHEAGKAFFETALGKVGPAAVRIGNGQGCPRGPDRSLLPLTVTLTRRRAGRDVRRGWLAHRSDALLLTPSTLPVSDVFMGYS